MTAGRFPADLIEALDGAKILGVRAGDEHRYTAVWPVVVDGRVFARSWQDKPTGWYRAFRERPAGSIQVEEREVPVRAVFTRSAALRDAVTEAFARKYDTKASLKWVEGFREPERAKNTVEFVPR